MSSQKKNIRLLTLVVFSIVFGTATALAQTSTAQSNGYDTSNLVIRICQGDLPGQKTIPGADYRPIVCAYSSKQGEFTIYEVVSFDLVNKTPDGKQERMSATGNNFSPAMRMMLVKADSEEKLRNIFFDNVVITVKGKQSLRINGLRPLLR